jgi:hypothetical protein
VTAITFFLKNNTPCTPKPARSTKSYQRVLIGEKTLLAIGIDWGSGKSLAGQAPTKD